MQYFSIGTNRQIDKGSNLDQDRLIPSILEPECSSEEFIKGEGLKSLVDFY